MNAMINGQTYQLLNNSSLKLNSSKELNSCILNIQSDEKLTFNKHDKIYFAENKFTLMSYNENVMNGVYTYTIIGSSFVKILENIIVCGMAETKTSDNLKTQMERIIYKINNFHYGQAWYNLEMNYNMKEKLQTKSGEEFIFDGLMNAREILDTMLEAFNADTEKNYIITVNDYTKYDTTGTIKIILDIYDTNIENGTEITDINKYGITFSQNSEYNVGGVVSLVDNTINKKLLITPYYELKSNNIVDKTSDYVFNTYEAINGIAKFEAWSEIKYQNDRGTITTVFGRSDITEYVVEKDFFDALSETEKNKHLYFTRNNNNIVNFYTKASSFLGMDKFVINIIEDEMKEYWGNIYGEDMIASVKFLYYKLYYYPTSSIILDTIKTNREDNLLTKYARILNQQSTKNVDLKRFNTYNENVIKSLGNREFTIDVLANNFTDLYNLKDYVMFGEDKYRLASIEAAFNNGFVNAKMIFNKDFALVNDKISLKKEKRTYDIPSKEYVDRYIYINCWELPYQIAITSPIITTDFGATKQASIIANQYLNNYAICFPMTNELIGYAKSKVGNTKTNKGIRYATSDDDETITIYLMDNDYADDCVTNGTNDMNNFPLIPTVAGTTNYYSLQELTLKKDKFERIVFVFVKNLQ